MITLIRHFTGIGVEKNWTMNLAYNYYILQDLAFKVRLSPSKKDFFLFALMIALQKRLKMLFISS